MQKKLKSQMCSIHQLDAIAIDFQEKNCADNVFLCQRCLSEKFLIKNNVGWISEVEEMIKELKTKEYQQQKKTIIQYSEMFSNLHALILNFQEQVNGCISKILAQIEHRQKEAQQSLESLIQPSDDNFDKQDFIKFIQTKERKQIFQGLGIEMKIENDQEFCKVIENQFQNCFSNETYQGIIIQLEDIKSFQNIDAPISDIKSNHQDSYVINSLRQKTESLHHLCKKHNKEIILINLEQETHLDRLCCIDCLSQFQKVPINLIEANQKWQTYQAKVWESESVFQRKRNEKYHNLKEILDNYRKSHGQIMEQIFLSLEQQGKNITNALYQLEQKNNFSSLFELEIENIYKAVNQLSQTSDIEQILQNQKIINSTDNSFYEQIFESFKTLDELNYQVQESLGFLFSQKQKQKYPLNYLKIQSLINSSNNLEEEMFSNIIPSLINEQQILQLVWKKILDLANKILDKKNKCQSTDGELNQNNLIDQEIMNLKLLEELYQKLEQKNSISKQGATQTTFEFSCQAIQNVINGPFKRNLKAISFSINKINQNFQVQATKIQQSPIQFNGYRFSSTLKNKSIILSNDFKKVKSQTSGEYYFCLFDQPIIKNGTAKVLFKILQCNWISLGVCLIDSINKDYEFKNCSNTGNGYYFLSYSNYFWSHHDNQKNNKGLGIKYGVNDVVTVEVNQQSKLITWRVNDKQCSLDIETTSDLYFSCCMMCANEVEII